MIQTSPLKCVIRGFTVCCTKCTVNSLKCGMEGKPHSSCKIKTNSYITHKDKSKPKPYLAIRKRDSLLFQGIKFELMICHIFVQSFGDQHTVLNTR